MILFDMTHTFFRTVFTINDPNNNHGLVAHSIFNNILTVAKKFNYSTENKVYIALDSKPSWRHNFYLEKRSSINGYTDEAYKGNRVRNEEIDWTLMFEIYDDCMQTLDNYSDFSVLKVVESEADDIIAILCRLNNQLSIQTTIVSSDKDFKQLQSKNVEIYDPIKRLVIPEVDTDFFLKKHILMGDKSDNILAVKDKVGEKTAEKMVKDLEVILQTNPLIKERYDFNRILIDFNCIPENIVSSITTAFIDSNVRDNKYNALSLMKCFQKYKLSKMTENVIDFKYRPPLKVHNQKKQQDNNDLEEFFS